MAVENKTWYYELANSEIWLWDEVSTLWCSTTSQDEYNLSIYILEDHFMFDELLFRHNTLICVACMQHIDVAFYYLRKKIRQFPEIEKRKVTTMDTIFSAKVRGLWSVYQSAPDKFDWASCESLLGLMLGVRVQRGASWFDVNTVLIPIHFDDLKHWALVKIELTNWTIEVYDSLQHEGPHNSKVRGGVDAFSKFIPMLAERLSLFAFKPREPPGTYPIPVTIMADIPRQGNG